MSDHTIYWLMLGVLSVLAVAAVFCYAMIVGPYLWKCLRKGK